MALKIRMRRQGRTNRPFYRVVVTNVESKRDGKYVEALGWYNPFEEESDKSYLIKADRVSYWLERGAELSEKTEALIKKAAPEIITQLRERQAAHQTKMAAKRRQRKKTAAA